MHESSLDSLDLICPRCRRAGRDRILQSPVSIQSIVLQQSGFILEGFLACTNQDCRASYPIVAGVPIVLKDLASWYRTENRFLDAATGSGSELETFFQELDAAAPEQQDRRRQLEAYLETHYRPDEMGSEAVAADHQDFWCRLIAAATPTKADRHAFSLDLGCSVGRFTFELAGLSELAVGLDTDFPAVAAAARFQREGRIRFTRRERGQQTCECTSSYAPRRNALFVVGDALDPPFSAEIFDLVSAVNLLDNVPVPLMLIGQMNALLRTDGIFVLCSPYAWRADITDPDEWIETAECAAPELVRRILLKNHVPQMALRYELLQENEDVPWILTYGPRQKSIFSAHVLSARKLPGLPG